MQQHASPIQLSAVLAAGKFWVIGTAVAGALIGSALGLFWPKHYEALAIMTLNHTNGGQVLNMETERLIASSGAVMTRAATELNVPVGDVRSSVSVRVPQGAIALEFFAQGSTANDAAAFANAAAGAYLDQVTATNGLDQNEQVQILQERVELLDEELARESANSSRGEALQERLAEAERQLLDIELGPAQPGTTGSLVTPAQPPLNSASPSLAVFIAGGLVAGGLLGMCLAVLSTRTRPSPDTTDIDFHDIVQGYQ